MSPVHQRRVRVFRNREGFFAPEKSWEMFCPCCSDKGLSSAHAVFTTWYEATAWALTHLQLEHCRFCIDRLMPAGREDVLGELYERCPACTPPCEDCDGIAVYPTNYNTPTELVEDLATLRLTPIFCDDCAGVVAVVTLDDPEVHA